MRLACNQPRWWNHFSQESGVSAKLIRFKEVLSGQSKMLMGSLLKFVCIGWRFFPFSINFFILFQYMEITINGKALFCMFSSFISNRLSIYFGLIFDNTSGKMNFSENLRTGISRELTKKGTNGAVVWNATKKSLSFFTLSSKKHSFTWINGSLILKINVS